MKDEIKIGDTVKVEKRNGQKVIGTLNQNDENGVAVFMGTTRDGADQWQLIQPQNVISISKV